MYLARNLWGAAFGSVCSFLWHASESQAAMSLDKTRLIVAQAARSSVVEVRNEDLAPTLFQIWVDQTSDAASPTTPAPTAATVPFVVDPPVLRLEPGQARAVRVLLARVPDSLPADRESLYWFNVLEIPGHTAAEIDADRLDVSVLTQLKLFYRPAALAGVQHRVNQNTTAPLHFALTRREMDDVPVLAVHNPAPIHQSLARLTLVTAHGAQTLATPTVAPYARTMVRLPDVDADTVFTRAQLLYTTLDDDGNPMAGETLLGFEP